MSLSGSLLTSKKYLLSFFLVSFIVCAPFSISFRKKEADQDKDIISVVSAIKFKKLVAGAKSCPPPYPYCPHNGGIMSCCGDGSWQCGLVAC